MSFGSVLFNGFGRSAIGQSPIGRPGSLRTFLDPDVPDDLFEIEFRTQRGTSFGKITTEIQRPIISDFEFRYDETGGVDWKATFTEQPQGLLTRFTEVLVYLAGVRVFWGYVWKSPRAQKTEEEPWDYSGFGMGKRLEKTKIQLKTGENVYQISEIEVSGSTVYVTTLEGLYTEDIIGCVCIVKDAESEDNNGRFEITGVNSGRVVFTNATGDAQSLTVGLLYILPREWSDVTSRISDVVKQVVQNYFSGLPIPDAVDLIEDTEEVTATVIDLDGMYVSDFFKLVRQLLPDWRLFPNADKIIEMRERETDPVAFAVIGYDFNDVKESENVDDIVNRWYVNRKQGKEEFRVGFKQGAFAQDDTSVARYGPQEDEKDVPVYWGDALCLALAEALVSRTKDPKETMTVENVPLKYYPIGPWKIFERPVKRESVISDCELVSEWAYDDELIVVEADTEDAIEGDASILVKYTGAAVATGLAEMSSDVSIRLLEPEYIRFWYRGSRIGQTVKFGFGRTAFTENLYEFQVYSGGWRQYQIDISDTTLEKIGQVGFQFTDSAEFAAGTYGFPAGLPYSYPFELGEEDSFRFDRITLYSVSGDIKTMNLTQVKVKKRTGTCDLTFGDIPEGLDKFLGAQMRSLVSSRLALKEK